MPDFLTVQETADKIGITRQAVQQLIDSKRLYAVWMLNKWAIPTTEAEKYRRQKAARVKRSNGNGHK